jgi:PAS domain S-box-containing protein
MKLDALSNEQLDRNLRELQRTTGENGEADRLQQVVQELQVHQIELEMHNRALRETQAELEASIQRYSDLYDNLPIAYVTVTAAGEILAANSAAIDWLHRSQRALIGAYFGTFFDSYDAGRLAAHLENCRHTRTSISIELTLRPPGGDPVGVQLSSRLAPHTDETEAQIHVAITNVAKMKDAQNELEEINREQEAFNYSISHDLRAPLITINNYAGIILTDHGWRLQEDGRSMVQRIQAAAIRMEATLKHLLAYSKLAREDIVLEAVDVERAVTELLIEHRGMIEETKAEVQVERPLPPVRGSALMLNQVLANLLTNAVKYTEPGQTAKIRIFAEPRGTQVVLKVADQGIGIDPKYHQKIFQLFERLHGYSRYPGSGVGLAIARRAIERMKGRIWVQSEAGKGSCFCLELPRG